MKQGSIGVSGACRKLKSTHALVATRESDYAKAQRAHEAARERLPLLEKQVQESRREAREAAALSEKHASGTADLHTQVTQQMKTD